MQNWLKKARGYLQELAANQGLNALKLFGSVVLVAFFIYVLWPLPRTAVEHRIDKTHPLTLDKQLELEDDFRKTFAQIIGGFVILGGLFMSFKTFGLSREGHITDRFTKAIEQLGKTDGTTPNIEVRLGAIYALERIALDSPRDHWTIMEVLTAYVRQNAPLEPERPYIEGEKPRTEVQAILTVLGRRKTDPARKRPEHQLDLSSSRLCGANLYETNLRKAYLHKANLQYARLYKANLQEAILQDADLGYADLEQANMRHAYLTRINLNAANIQQSNLREANLQYANLEGANLQNTYLGEAYLMHADLRNADLMRTVLSRSFIQGANLSNAKHLDTSQIQAAFRWQDALYSTVFRAELGLSPESSEAPRS